MYSWYLKIIETNILSIELHTSCFTWCSSSFSSSCLFLFSCFIFLWNGVSMPSIVGFLVQPPSQGRKPLPSHSNDWPVYFWKSPEMWLKNPCQGLSLPNSYRLLYMIFSAIKLYHLTFMPLLKVMCSCGIKSNFRSLIFFISMFLYNTVFPLKEWKNFGNAAWIWCRLLIFSLRFNCNLNLIISFLSNILQSSIKFILFF